MLSLAWLQTAINYGRFRGTVGYGQHNKPAGDLYYGHYVEQMLALCPVDVAIMQLAPGLWSALYPVIQHIPRITHTIGMTRTGKTSGSFAAICIAVHRFVHDETNLKRHPTVIAKLQPRMAGILRTLVYGRCPRILRNATDRGDEC
jgi:hypothetical protein